MLRYEMDPEPECFAAWVEHRLHESNVSGGPPRLYGLEFVDPCGFVDLNRPAGRLTFVADGGDASALVLGRACADAVGRYDAVALAATRWEPSAMPLPRPGGHPVRRRARVVTVVSDVGAATALRFDHDPEHVFVSRGLPAGGIAGVQLAAVWSGRAA
jgi:hypothetical protein